MDMGIDTSIGVPHVSRFPIVSAYK